MRSQQVQAGVATTPAARIDRLDLSGRGPRPTRKARLLYPAATALLGLLEQGTALERKGLRRAMEDAFGATDQSGRWEWKDAYEAAEAATVMFLMRYSGTLGLVTGDAGAGLGKVRKLQRLEPPQTRRSQEQIMLQQFSTPLELAYAAARAADVQPDDIVLEPSAGTGMLVGMIFERLEREKGGRLVLNELASDRSALLSQVFAQVPITRHNAETIGDRLPEVAASVVIMNPPFSRTPGIDGMSREADIVHVWSAYQNLQPGGRLVAITSQSSVPGTPGWRRAFRRAQDGPLIRLSTAVSGALYRSRGTTAGTRLTVLDRPNGSTRTPGAHRGVLNEEVADAQTLLDLIGAHVPPRLALAPEAGRSTGRRAVLPQNRRRPQAEPPVPPHDWGETQPLEYDSEPRADDGSWDSRPYQPWRPGAVIVEDAVPHPTKLVESGAMAAVSHRRPTSRSLLPTAVVRDGKLSDAQLESVALAADALDKHLQGLYQISTCHEKMRWLMTVVDKTTSEERLQIVTEEEDEAGDYGVEWNPPGTIRQGWMLGDGTGTGKGRQVAGILLDQWLRGRRRGLWLSQSDKLVEDAQRDWTAIGGRENDIIQLTKIRPGEPIPHSCGILFCTYATLRSRSRNTGRGRLEQIVDWLAGGTTVKARTAFDGVIIFDEAHAMQNAAGVDTDMGRRRPSQQGLAGLKLQNALPDARVVYVSATGASRIEGLAYAQRLGLWMSERTAFQRRKDFISAMESGGVAAMEVVARDLKAFGLYQARALSYDGIEIDILTHELSPDQHDTYNRYADGFQIIHTNIGEALEATKVVNEEGKTQNAASKAAANSMFESAKQRFFGHLLTSMTVPTLIRAIEEDQANDRASVVQLVSTGEALTERRLAAIPVEEWNDLTVDITPREYMIEYLRHGFPTTLHKVVTNENGDQVSVPVLDKDGNAVESQEAMRKRDRLIEELSALPPLGSALDLIVQHFGHEKVAEISGRSRRIVRVDDDKGERLALRRRGQSASRQETQDFMDGRKRILIFSGAGSTGRSYHADMSCGNTSKRVHYLLEPGWRADQAIQGLGRTHRTHQRTPPLFRPVTTDVKGQRRFISTIARRLDALGAITRGQRDSQTSMGANRSLFRASDNFESIYATTALRQFYKALHGRKIDGWSLGRFSTATGLKLTDEQGKLMENLPEMSKFLNRLLALRIEAQNQLFAELETRIEANIEQAIEKGIYNQGVETIRADHLRAESREVACTHPGTDSDTTIVEIHQKDRIRPLTADDALLIREGEHRQGRPATLLVNSRSGRAGLGISAPVAVLDDGAIQRRIRLLRPMSRDTVHEQALSATHWRKASEKRWREAWKAESQSLGEYRDSRFWLVTGVLLPIWKKLADADVRVYRLKTDDGEELLGRALTAAEITKLRTNLGLSAHDAPRLTATEIYDEAVRKRSAFKLVGGWRVSARMHMGRLRVEINGPNHRDLEALRRLGCRTEIVMHQTRIWAPDVDTLERVINEYPLEMNDATTG